MIKKISDLNSEELKITREMLSKEEYFLDFNYIMKNGYFIKIENNIAVISIRPATFDINGTIIYFLVSNCDISCFTNYLIKYYKNIYIGINDLISYKPSNDIFETINRKDNIRYPVDIYLCNDKNNIYRPLDYLIKTNIPEFNDSKLNYYNMSEEELSVFLHNNYITDDNEQLCWQGNDGAHSLLGLYYTFYGVSNFGHNYLISTLLNENNKETIVGIIKYNLDYKDSFYMLESASYIAYAETNYFYRQKGVYKKMINILIDKIEKPILVTSTESLMGELVHTHQIIVDQVKAKGLKIKVIKYNDIPKLLKR